MLVGIWTSCLLYIRVVLHCQENPSRRLRMCVSLPLLVDKAERNLIRVVDEQVVAVPRRRVLQRQACVLKVHGGK